MRNDVPASSVAASRSTASTRACGGPCCSQVASASMASASPAASTSTRPSGRLRSEEHTSELQSLMRISYAVFCLKKKKQPNSQQNNKIPTIRDTKTTTNSTYNRVQITTTTK